MPVMESPARLPGWTLLRYPDRKGVRYRAPDGNEVGAWAYNTALSSYKKTGDPPQSPVGTSWKRFQNDAGVSSRKSSVNDEMMSFIDVPGTDESISLDLPKVSTTPASRTKSGLFTAKEMSEGIQTLLVILTSLMAVATSLPEAQMTENEVRAISIPLANIFERSKYNKVIGNMIVGKSDYLTLGYALYVYANRVAVAARERRDANQPIGPIGKVETAPVPGTGLNGNGTGVPLRSAPSGLRGYTGNS